MTYTVKNNRTIKVQPQKTKPARPLMRHLRIAIVCAVALIIAGWLAVSAAG